MTFSLVARCADTGMFGMVIASSSPAVAARCAFARAGVGAVASQNVTDPRLGPQVLDLMAQGLTAAEAVAAVVRATRHAAFRQILAVDRTGQTATHTGDHALGLHGAARAADVAAGGNLLADPKVPQVMAAAFGDAKGPLGDRLIAALKAGLGAGGEAGPVHSAGLLIVDRQAWPYADLRCDWTMGDPVAEVAALWLLYAPQASAYVTRALDPGAAPRYGVAGDP